MRKNQKIFLSSSPDEFGTICTCVETPREEDVENKMFLGVDAEVRITDCERPINLEFGFNSKEQYIKRKEKIKTMIKALKKFEKEMDIGYKNMEHLRKLKKTKSIAS